MSESGGRQRHRRPAFFTEAQLEEHGGSYDPIAALQAAHETAAVLVEAGRDTADPARTERLIRLVDEIGLSTVAELWSACAPRSLPGALWRLYVVREWVRRSPVEVSRQYAAGIRFTTPNHVVAGAGEPLGPKEVERVSEEILRGVFTGDFAIALERAAAFCRVVAAGRAEGEDVDAEAAAHTLEMGEDLAATARLYRAGEIERPGTASDSDEPGDAATEN